ncbi:hypothetical protein AAG747_20915 [Rapidithrix thailandica]|uniref:Uncharacterized protein n=1 Tax=Rapidithrix thailandica TaxID=413964 RepID=A0AAW9SD61_9BACT
MKKIILILTVLGTIIWGQTIYAQTYPLGLNPLSLKWKQINTEKVQVVFPEGAETQGQRVVNIVHALYDQTGSIGDKNGKVSIFLHNRTTVSNGFVAMSPFRSELYLSPPQFSFLGTGNWLDLLTIHEYRHVQQNFNSRKGLSKLFYYTFGQNGWAFARAVALPRWFSEGDAVAMETALSHAGRGRAPQFDMEYRALLLNGKKYGYEKASAGSLKDFVPNHYNLGYYLTTYARREYGDEVWSKVVDGASRYKGLFYPLSHTLKKHTGLRTPQLYRATMEALETQWKEELNALNLTSSTPFNQKKKRTFTSYTLPVYLSNDRLLVEKDAFNEIRRFYQIDREGNEQALTAPGINIESNRTLSYAKGKITWAEIAYDERWANQSFSIIKTYDLQTGKKQKLTLQSRLFSPALSPDASQIAAVEVQEGSRYTLQLLDAQTGKVQKSLPNPDNLFFIHPAWMEDGQHVLVIAQQADGKQALMNVNIQTAQTERLTPFSHEQLSFPMHRGGYVYFSGAQTGIFNIFAFSLESRQLYQVTSTRLGAFHPTVSPDGKKLAYSEFTEQGYDIKEMPLSPEEWKSYQSSLTSSIDFYKPLVEQEGGNETISNAEESFEVKKYSKLSGLIYPHSLQPFFFHPDYSLELQFKNKFSTLQGAVGYQYNTNEESGGFYGNVAYGGWYPVLEAGFEYQNERNRDFPFLGEGTDGNGEPFAGLGVYSKEWKENDYYVGVTLPFNLTSGNHFGSLLLQGKYHTIETDYKDINARFNQREHRLRSGTFQALDFRLRFSRQQITATQHILPRFRQTLELEYKKTLQTEQNQGQVFRGTVGLYFPGLAKTHNLYLTGGYQKENFTDPYKFRNGFFYPRGYGSLWHDEIYRLSTNYTLPLWYPDVAIGSLAFIKRIYTNFFFDYSQATIHNIQAADLPNNTENFKNPEGFILGFDEQYRSVGVEIGFDFRALRLIDLGLGARYSYILDPAHRLFQMSNRHQFDFLILNLGVN